MSAHGDPLKNDARSDLAQVCSVRVGNGLYGIPIGHILEIVGNARVQAVPLAPQFVGGLMHYRGEVLTTISLRHVLEMPPAEGAQDLLVLENSEGCFGLLVDSVVQVLTVSSADFECLPFTVRMRHQAAFVGAYKLKEGLMIMLDAESLQPMRLAETA